jgi:hypothetical protein
MSATMPKYLVKYDEELPGDPPLAIIYYGEFTFYLLRFIKKQLVKNTRKFVVLFSDGKKLVSAMDIDPKIHSYKEIKDDIYSTG